MKYKLYLCGGTIRDRLLGLDSKDIDYSVVIENKEDYKTPEEAFSAFVIEIKKEGYEVFLETPSCLTVRAKFPKNHKNSGVVDFVISRKEGAYIKGTRTPEVTLGNIYEDAIRRDFSVNALMEDEEGIIIDFFNGQKDLQQKILRTPIDAAVSFNEDPLRILRAVRFAITKDFEFSDEIWRAIDSFDSKKMDVVSSERIMEELKKCFKHNTKRTFEFLRIICLSNHNLYNSILKDDFWLKPTNEQ